MVQNINNKSSSSSIKDQVAKKLNDNAAKDANAALTEKPQTENILAAGTVEDDNTNLRENMKSLESLIVL